MEKFSLKCMNFPGLLNQICLANIRLGSTNNRIKTNNLFQVISLINEKNSLSNRIIWNYVLNGVDRKYDFFKIKRALGCAEIK